MSEAYDVVVIGGGPCGSMASGWLAKQGKKVLLLEKERFPTYKVGESLIPHFWKYTDLLGVSEKISDHSFVKKAGGFVFWDGVLRRVRFDHFGYRRPALHVDRADFDQILLEHSASLGVDVRQSCQVKKVESLHDSPIVLYHDRNSNEQVEVGTKYVIDASGQNAFVARNTAHLAYDEIFRFQAYWAYFDKSDYLNRDGERTKFSARFEDPPMTLVSSTSEWGWAWHIVLRDRVSVGAVVPRSRLKDFKNGGKGLREQFGLACTHLPLISNLTADGQIVSDIHTVKNYAFRSKNFIIGNSYLAGDAAAFYDPINSEGITMALYGGYLSAWTVNNILDKPDRKEFYNKLYISQLSDKLRLFHLLAFPDEWIAEADYKYLEDIVKNQSHTESRLALTQLMITQRGKNFPDLLEKMNIDTEAGYQEFDMNKMKL